jgi:redox-sensitive bicupin YhaK (pirin superfamily)
VSGPVDPAGDQVVETTGERHLGAGTIQVREGRTATVGGIGIYRVLPTKGRRTIGPWCFVDLMSPDDIENPPRLEVGPHPHIGLATVTWLFAGAALHSDSLGTEQLIRPGELNLMTAGHGIAHAELGVEAVAAEDTGGILGVQMWLAQTDATRHGASSFQHVEELPAFEMTGGHGRVLVGEYAGLASPAVVDHPTVGLDMTTLAPVTVEAHPDFEYGIVPIDRPFLIDDTIVESGSLAIVPPGRESLHLRSSTPGGRAMVLGGRPLGVEIKMWWNFVARNFDELTAAWRDWQAHNDDRFGAVPSELDRIDAPVPPWVRG